MTPNAHWLGIGTLLALSLAGCGSSADGGDAPGFAVPGCEALDHEPCDVRDAGCQARLFALAGCLRESDGGTLPPVSLMSEQAYTDYLNQFFAENPRPVPDHWERAYALLGLVQTGAFSPQSVVPDRVASVAGFYRSDADAIVIVDHGIESEIEDTSTTLIHEFVHALQDQELDLAAFGEEHATTVDASFAASCLIEGEASLHHTRYQASRLGLDPATLDFPAHFQRRVANVEDFVLADPSPFRASIALTYAWGARYLHFAWEQGGQAAVREHLLAPPRTTRALLASTDGIVADLPPGPEIALLAAPEPWVLEGETTLGAWNLALVLSRWTAFASARELALGWRSDRIAVYSSTETQSITGLVLSVEFADEATAGTAAALALAGSPVRAEQRGTRVVWAAASPGAPLFDWAFEP